MRHPMSHSQAGAALITGLIFLVVLTLITLSATKSTSLEERMAGNARDQNVAFQAAEAGVHDAIAFINGTGLTPSSFGASCAAGLCPNDPAAPVWSTVSWLSSQTRAYGYGAVPPLTYDGTVVLPQQPRYIIELIQGAAAAPGDSGDEGGNKSGSTSHTYRVTARGWGLNTQTFVTLQVAINY